MFAEKTATTLEITVFVAYPVHAILLHVLFRRRYWFIGLGYTLGRFIAVHCNASQTEEERSAKDAENSVHGLPSSMLVLLESAVRAIVDLVVRKRKVRLLHESMKVVVSLLQEYKPKEYPVKIKEH